jgi:hypothetical protein
MINGLGLDRFRVAGVRRNLALIVIRDAGPINAHRWRSGFFDRPDVQGLDALSPFEDPERFSMPDNGPGRPEAAAGHFSARNDRMFPTLTMISLAT